MNNELDMLDLLAIISFAASIENLKENVNQSEMQETVEYAVKQINNHLEIQDAKIDEILKILKQKGDF